MEFTIEILIVSFLQQEIELQLSTGMPFIRRQLPACFDLVDCCDLDLLTFISDVDLDMIVTYWHAKN